MDKYASERKQETRGRRPAAPLTAHDIEVLVAYDRETGCLLKGDSRSGQVDGCLIEELRESGTTQRLLENQLIHPTGKLTPRASRRPAGWPAWPSSTPLRVTPGNRRCATGGFPETEQAVDAAIIGAGPEPTDRSRA